jgi:hypothetical protein
VLRLYIYEDTPKYDLLILISISTKLMILF